MNNKSEQIEDRIDHIEQIRLDLDCTIKKAEFLRELLEGERDKEAIGTLLGSLIPIEHEIIRLSDLIVSLAQEELDILGIEFSDMVISRSDEDENILNSVGQSPLYQDILLFHTNRLNGDYDHIDPEMPVLTISFTRSAGGSALDYDKETGYYHLYTLVHGDTLPENTIYCHRTFKSFDAIPLNIARSSEDMSFFYGGIPRPEGDEDEEDHPDGPEME